MGQPKRRMMRCTRGTFGSNPPMQSSTQLKSSQDWGRRNKPSLVPGAPIDWASRSNSLFAQCFLGKKRLLRSSRSVMVGTIDGTQICLPTWKASWHGKQQRPRKQLCLLKSFETFRVAIHVTWLRFVFQLLSQCYCIPHWHTSTLYLSRPSCKAFVAVSNHAVWISDQWDMHTATTEEDWEQAGHGDLS